MGYPTIGFGGRDFETDAYSSQKFDIGAGAQSNLWIEGEAIWRGSSMLAKFISR